MKKIFLFTITILFSHTILLAQEFKGKIKNHQGEPIPFATISVLNSPIGAVADDDGEFSIKLTEGSFQISVRALGYASKVISVQVPNEKGLQEIVLTESAQILDAVIVTANKREEEILQINTSVSSLSSKKVTDTRTLGLSGLTALVPNYLYQELGIGFQQIQSIRGIQVFSENPAVATYVDDVNGLDILANGFVFTDIERIEVLRGPQGTLFGRNAMGGVVNIITKKPTNNPNGFVNLETGNLGLQRYSAGYKTPLIKDKLFFGANGLYQKINGFMQNDTTGTSVVNDINLYGRRVGDEKNIYGNVFLKWLPSDNFNATLNIKGQRDWSEASGFFVSQPDEVTALENPDKIFLNGIGRHDRRIVNSALTLKYFTEKYTITSISAYQTIGLSFKDIDFPGFFHSFREKEIGEMLPPQEVWSQEARISSSDNSSRLQYTAGVFAFSQLGFEPSTNYAFEVGPDIYAVARNVSDNSGLAAFGEVTYKLTTKLSGTAGLRYDWESRKSIFGDASFIGGIFNQENPDKQLSGTYNALSPKLAFSYASGINSNVYLSYNRGFRAGGINAQVLPPGISYTFDPEFSDNFEAGYKMKDAGNRFSLAASAFYIKWKDIQFFNIVAPGVFARENVGNGTSMGLELEASAVPAKGLQLDGSLGVLNATYDDFLLKRVNFATLEEVNIPIGGNKLSNAPSHTLFIGAQYALPLTQKANFVVRGEVRNIGEFYTDIQNDLRQPSYTLLNSRMGINYEKYSLFIWGQNLTNERYLVFGTADSFSNRRVRTSAPRTFGITINAQF